MKIALISCGRSDYSIYKPLIYAINQEKEFSLDIIVFGTHVSTFHGYTANEFIKDGFEIRHKIESLLLGDSKEAIATAMGLTTVKFAALWAKEQYDLIFVLGDRYEMFAAIAASVPFNIPVAHLHGGETTLGAIDEKFRHSLTCMSTYHFTSTAGHAERVKQIVGNSEHIYNVGALALDNLNHLDFLDPAAFRARYNIDLEKPTILSTYHPETVSTEGNISNVEVLFEVFEYLKDKQVIITMPNADTMGNQVRSKILELAALHKHVIPVESLGLLGYYSCARLSEFVIGNSSSGIIEMASFGKYVINIGDRQKGRESGENVFHCDVNREEIVACIEKIKNAPALSGDNIYGNGEASKKIVDVLKKINALPRA